MKLGLVPLCFLMTAVSVAQPLPPPALRADDGCIVDVMVLYTQNARAIAGGSDTSVDIISAAITGVNQAFGAVGVMTQLNVVAYHPVFCLEQVNEDFHADLNYQSGASDGYLDKIHALREYYAADLMLLVTGTWSSIDTGDSATRAIVPVELTQNGGFEVDMDINGVPDFRVRQGWTAGDKHLCNKPSKVIKKNIRIYEVSISYNGRQWQDQVARRI